MAEPTLPPSAPDHRADRGARVPGLIVVFAGGAAAARPLPVPGPLELGRLEASPGHLDDGRVSRRHARVDPVDGRLTVTDLGSQNGTFVDGERAPAHVAVPLTRALRLGDTVLVPCADLGPLREHGVRERDGLVRGPATAQVLAEAERAARAGTHLHIRGETGTGKEGVAQAFHRAGPRATGALISVNCAAIPQALAERLLFGARRGAYSGADADATGYLQEADGGTLFLDELGELDLAIQAKLLRVLETHEVTPLGAARARRVDLGLCSATHQDLRAQVAAGRLRDDLYYRIASPAVTLPPLRERPEEIPALVDRALAQAAAGQAAHVSLIERCLLLPWPGNVRELLAEVRAAAQAARADGGRVHAHHLSPTAGSPFAPAPAAAPTPPPGADDPRRRISRTDGEWRQRIEDGLRAHGGNIAATARALGLHRTQLRRLMEHHGITATAAAGADAADDDADRDDGPLR